MSEERFEKRLSYLRDNRYPVLTLERALHLQDTDRLPPCSTVLTIDDGWVGTAKVMAPLLKKHGFEAMLYASTYYIQSGTSVFNVAIDYVLWKSNRQTLEIGEIVPEHHGVYDLSDPIQRQAATGWLLEHAESLSGAVARQRLLERVCNTLNVDFQPFVTNELFRYMSAETASRMSHDGLDVQLHTHRHRFFGLTREEVIKEIEDNRAALADIASKPLVHFCYPSGEYDPEQVDWLRTCGVKTSTTTKGGLVGKHTDRMQLGRFLDAEQVTDIEFAAEVSGFCELLRIARIR